METTMIYIGLVGVGFIMGLAVSVGVFFEFKRMRKEMAKEKENMDRKMKENAETLAKLLTKIENWEAGENNGGRE